MLLGLDDDLELDTALFELRRTGRAVPMEPQAFDVLAYLVSHRTRVVSKEELDAVWGGRFVSETAVTSRIEQVRRAIGRRRARAAPDPHSAWTRFTASSGRWRCTRRPARRLVIASALPFHVGPAMGTIAGLLVGLAMLGRQK